MIPIRALQHYLYCPHRWAALYLSGEWRENALTVRAGIALERVHSGKTLDTRGGAKTLSGVTLYSIKLGIYGKADILEVWQSGEKTSVRVVEYKPSKRAVMLNEGGRKKVLEKWQEKKREEFRHSVLGQKIQYGLLPFVQANLLAKYVRGEIGEYPPYIVR